MVPPGKITGSRANRNEAAPVATTNSHSPRQVAPSILARKTAEVRKSPAGTFAAAPGIRNTKKDAPRHGDAHRTHEDGRRQQAIVLSNAATGHQDADADGYEDADAHGYADKHEHTHMMMLRCYDDGNGDDDGDGDKLIVIMMRRVLMIMSDGNAR